MSKKYYKSFEIVKNELEKKVDKALKYVKADGDFEEGDFGINVPIDGESTTTFSVVKDEEGKFKVVDDNGIQEKPYDMITLTDKINILSMSDNSELHDAVVKADICEMVGSMAAKVAKCLGKGSAYEMTLAIEEAFVNESVSDFGDEKGKFSPVDALKYIEKDEVSDAMLNETPENIMDEIHQENSIYTKADLLDHLMASSLEEN